MKTLFNPEGIFFQFLSRVGDLIILNFLFLICCVPVITAGASLAAMYKVVMDMHYEAEGGMFKGFFRAFRDNFRQATILWVILLVIFVSLGCDLLLVITYFGGSTAMYVLLAVLAVLVLCVSAYMIPLIIRYKNSLRQHVSNAIILAIVKLPRTVAMVAMNLLPLIIALISLNVFFQTLIFWLFIGFSFVAYININLMKPVYAQLEADKK